MAEKKPRQWTPEEWAERHGMSKARRSAAAIKRREKRKLLKGLAEPTVRKCIRITPKLWARARLELSDNFSKAVTDALLYTLRDLERKVSEAERDESSE